MLFLVEKSYAADADAAILVGCAVTKMVKNDCGEGRQTAMRIGENIYKRKDGRWEARTAIGRKKNGRLSYRSFYGRTYREVKKKKLDYEMQNPYPALLDLSGENPSFRLLCALWFAEGRQRWKHSTCVRYQSCLNRWLIPAFGSCRLSNITQNRITQAWKNWANKTGTSQINLILAVLSGLQKYARKAGYTGFSIQNLHAHRRQSEITIFTETESGHFVKGLSGILRNELSQEERGMALGFLLTRYTGLRIGELCAVRKADFRMDEQYLVVSHTLQRLPVEERPRLLKTTRVEKGSEESQPSERLTVVGKNNLSEGKKTALLLTVPKNGKTRAVPLHPALLPLLETWLSQLQDGDFLLTGTRYPVEPRTCSNRFKKFLKDCGLRDTHFHTLRHTFATECVESGVNLKVLSEILGHSSIQITASRYIHLSMRYKKQQISFLAFPGYAPSDDPSENVKTA